MAEHTDLAPGSPRLPAWPAQGAPSHLPSLSPWPRAGAQLLALSQSQPLASYRHTTANKATSGYTNCDWGKGLKALTTTANLPSQRGFIKVVCGCDIKFSVVAHMSIYRSHFITWRGVPEDSGKKPVKCFKGQKRNCMFNLT